MRFDVLPQRFLCGAQNFFHFMNLWRNHYDFPSAGLHMALWAFRIGRTAAASLEDTVGTGRLRKAVELASITRRLYRECPGCAHRQPVHISTVVTPHLTPQRPAYRTAPWSPAFSTNDRLDRQITIGRWA